MSTLSRHEAEQEGTPGTASDQNHWKAPAAYQPAGQLDDRGRSDPGEPSDDASMRSMLLAKAVEYEIIPRLMLAHRSPEACSEQTVVAAQEVSAEDVRAFSELVLHESDEILRTGVATLRNRGVPVESILLDLLGPVARHLGELWERDLCTFTEVTVGLGRLQQVLRENSAGMTRTHDGASAGKRILLLPCPGEQHTFGLSVVAEFFHRAGWDVSTSFVPTTMSPASMVRQAWYDVVGFSLGGQTGVERLRQCIVDVRKASQNPHLSIIAGGAIFLLHPEFAGEIDSDAILTEGSLAPDLASKLVANAGAASKTAN